MTTIRHADHHHPRTASNVRRAAAATFGALLIATASCGSDPQTSDPASAATDGPSTIASNNEQTTEAPAPSDTPTTTALSTDPPTSPPASEPTSSPPTVTAETRETNDVELAAQIEALLAEALAPGSMGWDLYDDGVEAPATAAVAAVRIPGRDDVLVAAGENVDATPAVATAPFSVATLTESLVKTLAFQMIDEGVLDPSLTVDEWAPSLPNADRVTVQMLIDNATGWSDYGILEPDPILTDFARVWSLREVVDLRASVMTALAEPGTETDDGAMNDFVLGFVVEEVGGRPLADLVRDRITGPAGLEETGLLDGRNQPAGYRHGVFAFNGTVVDTSAFDPTSYLTWEYATKSAFSTPSDLLDLVDAWASGELFTTDRTPAPQRFAAEPVLEDGEPFFVAGIDVPFNGFCPCTEVDDGTQPAAFGRTPANIGTVAYLLRFTDGISVVLHLNSRQGDATTDVAFAIHDLAASAN